jgi:hypothetical protein
VSDVDTVARAIFDADMAYEPRGKWFWESLHPSDQEGYRRQAQAAIDALGLTEEWVAVTDGGVGHPSEKRVDAEETLRVVESNNARFLRNEGRIPEVGLNPRIHTRLVSPWVKAEIPA